jgi:hypothetical protein
MTGDSSWRRAICDGPVPGSAMLRKASWNRSNSFWGTSQFKPPNGTLAASSGFDQLSMIALASSRILELGARLWKSRRPPARNFAFRIQQPFLTP